MGILISQFYFIPNTIKRGKIEIKFPLRHCKKGEKLNKTP
jgi:hypothetical protein